MLNICDVKNNMYKINGNKISLLVILVNTFPMILIIIDTIVRNEDDFNYWFNEYHNFLLYIIVSINNIDDNCNEYFFIHDQCLDAIVFSITFLTKFKTETKGFQCKVDKLLIKIFKYILIFLKKTNAESIPHSKSKNCLVNIFYNIFTGLTYEIMQEMEKNDYKGVIQVLNSVIFEKFFFTNEKLKQRINASINTWKHYALIVSQRYSSNQDLNLSINFSFKTSLNPIVHQGEIEKILHERDVCSERKRKMLFKLVMKKYQDLFLFQQFWSDKSLFYNNVNKKYVKYKVVNFLCEDYAKPFLKPFIDIRNNLPNFLHDKINKTFNDESNIENYYDFHIENKFKKATQFISNELSLTKYNESYIINHFIYQIRNVLLKEYHTILHNTINTKQIENIDLNYTIKTNPEKQIVFPCCFVKLTYHIKGVIIIDKQKQTFTFHAKLSSTPCIMNSVQNKKLCVGSLFEIPYKISHVKSVIIPYKKINVLLRYSYYYKRTGVSLIAQNNKQYIINFHNETDRENFLKEIISSGNFSQLVNDFFEKNHFPKTNFDKDSGVVIGYFNKKWNKQKNNLYKLSKVKSSIKLKKILKKWKNHKISNYKFIMILNFLGNRSYMDVTQYPVFPWTFNSHLTSDSLDLPMNNNIQSSTLYRDFSLPVGMLFLQNSPELNPHLNSSDNWFYNYGTHYSNQVYTSYYLLRLFPFYSLNLEIHDQKIDTAQCLFSSLETSFKSLQIKGDVRELIPEFFTCPEMFINVNSFFFENAFIQDCNTPCESNQYEFVSKKKRGIESIEVTNNIFKWIDLIFGYKQKGKEGIKAYNIFARSAYFEDIDLHTQNMNILYVELEFGLVPSQLFPKEVNVKYIRKIKPGTKYEMYINNENEASDDIYNVLTNIEKGVEIIGFAIIDNFRNALQKNDNSIRKISVDSIFLQVDQLSAFVKGLELEEKKRKNVIDKERYLLLNSECNFDKVIYTLSLMNNNYLYITSICINKKDKAQCKSVIIQKSLIAKSIPLCKMDTTFDKKNKLLYNYISFSEKCSEMFISGFSDRKIIIVSLSLNEKEYDIDIETNNIYSKYFTSPLTTSCSFTYWENTYLLIGDQNGNLFLLKKHLHLKYILIKVIHDHLHEIKFITYDSHLKCVATSSKDGYVNIYLVPSFNLLNSFQIIKNLSIDKVFLFHTPLYCFIAYCKEMDTLFCHSLNIEQILYEYEPDGEQSLEINNPIVIEKGNANEYIAFANERNEILVLTIPEMSLFKKRKIDFEVHMLEYSKEDNVLIAVDKGLGRMAYVEIWE